MRGRTASQRATVVIDGTAMEIWVTRSGQDTWRARGFFNSNHIEAIGPSQLEAASAWQSQASFAGTISQGTI